MDSQVPLGINFVTKFFFLRINLVCWVFFIETNTPLNLFYGSQLELDGETLFRVAKAALPLQGFPTGCFSFPVRFPLKRMVFRGYVKVVDLIE